MSFGIGIGDFIAVGKLAWQVYKSCKEAPESFKNVSQEVLSLHAVLKEIEEVLEGQTLSATREARLATITKGCREVLRDLQTLVRKYESLGSKTRRTWDRLKWHSDDITELRARLICNTSLLTAFVSTSQIIVERQLNKFMHEYQDGKHEPSVITTMTAESLSMDEKQLWRSIRKELEDIGISVTTFNANKDFILTWFQETINKGAFQERAVEEYYDSDLYEGDLPLSLADLGITTENPGAEGALLSLDKEYTKIEERESPQIEDMPVERPQTTSTKSVTIQGFPVQTPDCTTLEPKQDTTASRPHMTQREVVKSQSIRINRATKSQKLLSPDSHLEMTPRKNRSPRLATLINRLLGHERALLRAVSRGDSATFKNLLSGKGFKVESQDMFKKRLLLDAISSHKKEMVVLLLDHVDIKAKNWRGILLHAAVVKNDKEIVKLFLEKGASIDSTDRDFNTPLHVAAGMGYLDLVRMLLDNHASLDRYNKYGEVALVTAAASGRRDMVELLLIRGADPSMLCSQVVTPLIAAIRRRADVIVKLLLEKGADPNHSGLLENAPLRQAVSAGDDTIVALLIEHGANVNRDHSTGNSALAQAVLQGQESTVKLLLDNGADPVSLAFFGVSLISQAKTLRYEAIARLLLDYSTSNNKI